MRDLRNSQKHRFGIEGFVVCAVLCMIVPSGGQTVAPYAPPDAATLHLWHLDEKAVPAADAVKGANNLPLKGLLGGATLGSTSLTGFGQALQPNTSAATGGILLAAAALSSGAGDNVPFSHAHPRTGAFTYEAIIKFDSGYDPTTATDARNMEIISMEGDGANDRVFQFRFVGRSTNAGPNVEFANLRPTPRQPAIAAPVPLTGPNAVNNSDWFHVAVTYTGEEGTPGNLKFYWTRIRSGVMQAALLGTETMKADLQTVAADFAIGNEARTNGGETEGFAGLIDEVRISSVARTADSFIFVFIDKDADGLLDSWEQQIIDADGSDKITALEEVLPADDFDGDGSTNAEEHAAGTDPTSKVSVPGDTDSDGLRDEWEMNSFDSLDYKAGDDPDGDASLNSAEQSKGTDPNDPLDYAGAPVDPAKPTGLMVDLLEFPRRTTVPDTQPEFSWIFHPVKPGESQSAYEIIVASTALLAGAGTGDVWSSDKVSSGESVNVPFGGSPLTRGETYHWRVRTWGDSGTPGSWSKIQTFTIEPTKPAAGARSVYKSSSNPWSGRYPSAFDTTVAPTSIVKTGPGRFFVDFGRDAFGYLTLHLNGSYAGQSLEVRFGEKAKDNSVDTAPPGSVRYSSTLIALANGDVTYEIRPPATTFPGYAHPIDVTAWAGNVTPFRYAELINCPAPVTRDSIRQRVLHYPFDDEAATFDSSNSALDAVWELCRHSMKATSFCSVYVDGDRERTPYEGDVYINQLSHYAADREYTLARYTFEYLLDHHTWPTEWRFHFPLIAWADYMYTGNLDALAANYDTMKEFLRIDRERTSDNLLKGWPNNGTRDPSDLIDWPRSPNDEADGYVQTDYSNVINAFHFRDLQIMAEVAELLSKPSDASDFSNRADKIKKAFNDVFWDPETKQYKDGETTPHASAHANFFPIAMGLTPPSMSSVMDYLKTTRTILGRTERMPCSVYGAQYYLEALFEGGEEDYAISLMADADPDRKRHWTNMMTEGSTITMEAWGQEFKGNQDWNHAWGAAPGNIIPRYVLGLKPIAPGFAKAEIKPQMGTGSRSDGLTTARGTIPTIRGPVTIDAKNSPTSFKLRVKIPGNMTANIHIPVKGHATPALIYDGEVVFAPVVDGRLVLENVPGGEHTISLSQRQRRKN